MILPERLPLHARHVFLTKKTIAYQRFGEPKFRTVMSASLHPRLADWCKDHLRHPYWVSVSAPFAIEFQSAEDAVLFKLWWSEHLPT